MIIKGFVLSSQELEQQEEPLIAQGTYLVVEKLKVVAYRNLVRHVCDARRIA